MRYLSYNPAIPWLLYLCYNIDMNTSPTPETTHSASPDPKVQKWLQDYQIRDQDRRPINSSRLIVDGPDSQPITDLDEKGFQHVFLQAMCQGAALDGSDAPRFFHPKAFLQSTDRRIFRSRIKSSDFANGLNSIAMFKNLPANRLNLSLQQEANSAIAEYLDPELFAGNFVQDSELLDVFELLESDALEDPDILAHFNAAHVQRENLKASRQAALGQAAINRASGYEAPARTTARERGQKATRSHRKAVPTRQRAYDPAIDYTPNPGSFRIDRDTTISQVLGELKNSPNRAGFERINALQKWGEFIQANVEDPHYEEEIISFGSHPRKGQRAKYSNDDTYAVIAFDYAGRRCMIAESCGSGGANSTAAAMKIWRSEPENIGDKQGWLPVFASSKTDAKGLCQTLRHSDFAAGLAQRDPGDEDHIIEAEDRMFRSAFRYFETGELLGGGKSAATNLDNLIGPEFRRPNPQNSPASQPQQDPQTPQN